MKKFILSVVLGLLPFFAFVQTFIPLPPQSSPYSGGTRGYYFTSPTCFTITGLRVPTDASSGSQSIEIVRLPAIPPTYPSVTNTFTVLGLYQNSAISGIIPVNIPVNSGDVIGVLGYRGGVNSYGTSPFSSTIGGFPVTLTRFGFQSELTTVAAFDVWTEVGGSISRVELYYVPGTVGSFTSSIVVSAATFTALGDTSSSYTWDFGDGTTGTGMTTVHNYTAPGTYNVCLYVSGTCGNDTVCNPVTICFAPVSNYSSVGSGLTVNFTDISLNTPTSWSWDFGDGGTSTSQNPSHIYTSIGTYYVCLIASSSCGTDTFCDSVNTCSVPVSAFSSTVTGATATFTNTSVWGLSWSWDFGDGATDTSQHPVHTYSLMGTYTVCLITTGACGTDTFCRPVVVCTPSVAQFQSTMNWDSVFFQNNSQFANSVSWSFGDGSTSTLTNPQHIYTANGNYVVTLITDNPCGRDTFIDTITVCTDPPVAGFTFVSNLGTFTFTNTSTGAVSNSWDYGDGNLSNNQNPVYTFSANGTYTVCLTITDLCGNVDVECQTVSVLITERGENISGEPFARVYPNPSSSIPNLVVGGLKAGLETQVLVFDAKGQQIESLSLPESGEYQLFRTIPAAGLYQYILIQNGLTIAKGKAVIQ